MAHAHNIYIHVPFCMSKCNYCAFFSRACANPDWEKYSHDIIYEIDHWANMLGQIDIPTIFFGGGTPSLMPTKTFEKIISHLSNKFNITPNCEITLESNPGTLDDARLSEFIDMGINRLSIGVQSFDDTRLQFLGRRHSAADAIRLINNAMSRNIRVSGDFIYGMPGDTTDDIIKLCKQINNIGLQHASLYELTIEENTPFGKMNLEMPTNTEMADMYNAIDDNLALPRYEVSNYATPSNECRHNQNVWDGDAYIGIGMGAAGRVLIDNTWYEQMGNGAKFERILPATRATEKIITGLRQVRGVKCTDDVMDVINIDFIYKNPDLITQTNSRISVTKKGMLILDEILLNLIR